MGVRKKRGKPRVSGVAVYRLVVAETGIVLAEKARVARSPWARLVGLIGRRSFPEGEALLLPRTRWVHTFFMRFPIDVVYLDGAGRIIAIDRHLRPWRIARPRFRTAQTVELPAGAAGNVEAGQHVRLQTVDAPEHPTDKYPLPGTSDMPSRQ